MALTVIHEADWRHRLQPCTLHRLIFLKATRQTAQKVLSLFVQPQPQVYLQFSLDRPASWTKALLSGQLHIE